MAARIIEFYGFAPNSEQSLANAQKHHCPFVDNNCIKKPNNGACSLQQGDAEPVIICPNRLYDSDFGTLKRVAEEAFGLPHGLLAADEARSLLTNGELPENSAAVFGKYFGGEIGIPSPAGLDGVEAKGSFKIDFIVSQLDSLGQILSFVAVEVQTIDTTSSYAQAGLAYSQGEVYVNKRGTDLTPAGFNWENVSKRILPQLIYKGHALRREPLCKEGLYFILPHPVFEKIRRRIGGDFIQYPRGPGTITFQTYRLGELGENGRRDLLPQESITTTVEQIAFAFVSPRNLPDAGVYEAVVKARLEGRKIRKRRKN